MGKVLYGEAAVAKRIREMAAQIVDNYDSDSTVFVSLLNGAVPFTYLLMRAIYELKPDYHPNVQYLRVSRYGASRVGGQPAVVQDLPPAYQDLSSYKVVLVDDMVDFGDTLAYAKQHLFKLGAQSVDCVVLVKKQKTPPAKIDIALYGFEAPDAWLVGMGMDDHAAAPEAERWAPWIATA